MAEIIYQYYKELPQFRPNKFDIVGGFGSDANFNNYVNKIGGYYGGGEYEIDTSELNNIEFVSDEKIVAIGGFDAGISGTKSASTVEPGLLEMFSIIDKRNLPVISSKRRRKLKMKRAKGAGSNKQYLADVAPDSEPIKFSDISDEILYKCPNFDGGYDSDDNLINNIDDVKENEYQLAVEIDNLSSENETDTDEESDDNESVEHIENISGGANDTSQPETYIDFDDDDTNIMKFLND